MWRDFMEDPVFMVIGLVCGVLLMVCVLGIAGSISSASREAEMLKRNACTLISKEPTGARVYCGKACFRDEIRRIYSCSTGSIETIH